MAFDSQQKFLFDMKGRFGVFQIVLYKININFIGYLLLKIVSKENPDQHIVPNISSQRLAEKS